MAKITKVNSGKALVHMSREELVENNLDRWLRADSLGTGHRYFTAVQPIEKVAARLFNEKYPSETVKIGERFFYNTQDGSVDVVLRIAESRVDGYYNSHPVKLTYEGFPAQKKLSKKAAESKDGIFMFGDEDVDYLIEHIAEMDDDELDLLEICLDREKSAEEILSDEEKDLFTLED